MLGHPWVLVLVGKIRFDTRDHCSHESVCFLNVLGCLDFAQVNVMERSWYGQQSYHWKIIERSLYRIGFQSFCYTFFLPKGEKDSPGMRDRTIVPYFVFVFLIS